MTQGKRTQMIAYCIGMLQRKKSNRYLPFLCDIVRNSPFSTRQKEEFTQYMIKHKSRKINLNTNLAWWDYYDYSSRLRFLNKLHRLNDSGL